jgi:hypothetical protein
MKLVLQNIGSGFQTLGRGTMATGPMLGLSRQSEIQISPEQFLDYEFDIRYYHTAKCGEVKMSLTLDGQIATPDEVRELIDAAPEEVEPPAETRTHEEQSSAAVLVASGLTINHAGPVDTAAIAQQA